MSSQEVGKKRGRPKGSKNKPKIEEQDNSNENENEENIVPNQLNESKKVKRILQMAFVGLKKMQEFINLSVTMIEKAEKPQDWLDTMNTAKSMPHLIHCEEKIGWMDIGFCGCVCKSKCYKFNTGRWICYVLRCSNEKITTCDEKDKLCDSANLIKGFINQYLIIYNQIYYGAKHGDNN